MTFFALLAGSAATVTCVCYLQVGGISVLDSLITPEHARPEVVRRQHKDVVHKIEAIIQLSANAGAAERRALAANWPHKVVHVSVNKAHEVKPTSSSQQRSPDSASGYSRTTWTNLRAVVRNGSGHGSLITAEGQSEIVVVDSIRQCAGRDKVHYTIYIELPKKLLASH